MNELRFLQVTAGETRLCRIFTSLMEGYMKETSEHTHHELPQAFFEKWVKSIIVMQGAYDRHLELCFNEDAPVGFLYGKIDHEEHKGFIKPGYGYIMEFYVLPEHRRRGYGRAMLRRMEELFRDHGAKAMYLTADPVTGKPFWEAMGFENTGERSPENQLDIYEKRITPQVAAAEAAVM